MREARRRIERSHLRLRRSADGRLLPAADDDIGDIWAEQQRIRLREAILEDKRKKERKQRRRQLFVGAAQRLRAKISSAPEPTVRQSNQKGGARSAPQATKEIQIRLTVPQVRVPSLRGARRLLARVPWSRVPRKYALVAVCVVAVTVLGYGGLALFGGGKHNTAGKHGSAAQKSTLGASDDGLKAPDYATVLPAGKTIEDLGGWGRVSPKGQAPVFAYVDSLAGVKVIVSEQPLPKSLADNPTDKVKKLAEQFSATQEIAVDAGTVAYLGNNAKTGEQSVVATKDGLLILIKSSSEIPLVQWGRYIDGLQSHD